MAEQVSFNINAELYENKFGELAIRFPGEKVYKEVGTNREGDFISEAVSMLEKGEHPAEWKEMAPHELLYGNEWHCISRMGYVEGDVDKPGIEFEVKPEEIGEMGRTYLRNVLH